MFNAKLAYQLKEDLSSLEEIMELLEDIRTDISDCSLENGEALDIVKAKFYCLVDCDNWELTPIERIKNKRVKSPCQYCKHLNIDRDPGTNEVYPICFYGDPGN